MQGRTTLRILLVLALVIVSSLAVYRIITISRQERKPVAARPTIVKAKSGMVATANQYSTRAGIEILKKGGNAVDAAVAAAFALGAAEPFASGIGGGGFMLIYSAKSKQVVTIDYRETAPSLAKDKVFRAPSSDREPDDEIGANLYAREGHDAAAVPGTVAGLALALKNYGTMDLKGVISPAIEIAENGVEVGRLLNSMMRSNFQKLSKFPEAAAIYLKNGIPYEAGDKLYLKDLARTYRLIAEKGPDVFYKGEIAEAIEKEMRGGRGRITRGDLAAYQPVSRAPVSGAYRGYEIFSMGPPSSGGTHIIEMLNILEGFDISRLGSNTAESIPVMAEAMKAIFSDRARFMGDPDFVKVPLDELLSKARAENLRKKIRAGGLNEKILAANFPLYESVQTSHISVVDGDGNLVALTQTINSFFGSGVVVPGTGILLNNEMNDFAYWKGSPNSVEPGKRPLSSMSPTLVLKDGKPFMTIGMPGAARIITVLPQIIMNLIDHGMDIQKAIDAPRIHCLEGREIFLESRVPDEVRNALIRKGYRLTFKKDFDLYFGGAQAVLIDPKTGKLNGGADPRREGSVMGF